MKLHRIAVTNLNSLYGDQEVDLEGGLGDAPLFLVVGPTGSGKSTLLDAVCLALFGVTPRLARTRADGSFGDDDPRRMISHGTGGARAEVEFSKLEPTGRRRYRAVWSVHRARRHPDGRPQRAHRSLERFDPAGGGWEAVPLVSSDLRKVYQPVFDRVLEGMRVEEFHRAILLAQGQFAAFLQAGEQDRAAILERLTETGIYRELGSLANQRRRRVEAEQDERRRRIDAVSVLPEEERAARTAEARDLGHELEGAGGLIERRDALLAAVSWQRSRLHAEAELRTARAEVGAVAREHAAAALLLLRLSEHERCEPARRALRAWQEPSRARAEEAERLPALRAAEAEAGIRRDEAELARVAAAARRAEEERARAALVPALQEARTKAALAAQAAERAAQADAERGERSSARRRAEEALAAAQRALRAWTERDEELNRKAQDLVGLEGVEEALSGLQARVDELLRRGTEAREAADRRARTAEMLAEVERERAEAEPAAERAEQAERAALAEAEGAERALEALAVEGPPEELLDGLRVRAENLERRAARAEERVARLSELAELDRRAREAGQELAESRRAAEEAERGRASRIAARSAAEEGLAALDRHLDDLRWALRVAEERGRLRSGRPCPLCGSEQHPLADDAEAARLDAEARARVDALEAQRGEARRVLLEARDAAESAQLALGRSAAQVAAAEARSKGLEERRAELRTGLVGEDLPDEPEAARAEADRCHDDAGALRRRIAALDEALRVARRLRDAASATSRASAEAGRALRDRQARAHATEERLAREDEALTAAREAEARLRRELDEALSALGGEPGVPAELALRGLEERVARGRALREERRASEESGRGLREGVVQAGAEAEAARAAEAGATAAWEREVREATARAAECAGLLGGRPAELVDAESRQRLQRAVEEAERAGRARDLLAEEANAAYAERHQLEDHLEELDRRIGVARSGLHEQLGVLALESVEELEARLLPDPRRAELDRFRDGLSARRAEALARADERRRRLDGLHASRPRALAEDRGLAELEAEQLELEDRVASARSALARLQAELAIDEARRKEHARLVVDYERAAADAKVWKRLHALIGVRDGEALQRFAQVLNLGELIAKANDHLARLSERYLLDAAEDEDGPRLSFAVIDRWQADERRPPATLSGGETFLVSLALALALADFRAARMPIETLLLDEGFGTLDRETLETALSALDRLRAGGTQVGIISHVELLKERIEAQVSVERLGDGRSQVRLRPG